MVSYFNGQVSMSFLNVFFIVPSGFPQDVSVNKTTPYSISLMWPPPPLSQHNWAIIHYIVNVTHIDTLENKQYYSTVTSITITGLDPYTTYVCVNNNITVYLLSKV